MFNRCLPPLQIKIYLIINTKHFDTDNLYACNTPLQIYLEINSKGKLFIMYVILPAMATPHHNPPLWSINTLLRKRIPSAIWPLWARITGTRRDHGSWNDGTTTDYERHPAHSDYTGSDVTPGRRKCSHSKSSEVANAILPLHFSRAVYNHRFAVWIKPCMTISICVTKKGSF